MAGGYYLRVGVWWDMNTCPVPAGINPLHVRASIESALRKHIGPRPVTIFACGNLEYISPSLLEAISSTGILLRHFPDRGRALFRLVRQWRWRKILLISGDGTWSPRYYTDLGYTVLRATPEDCRPLDDTCDKEWDWETLLKENSNSVCVEKSKSIMKEDEPAWFCDLCEITSQSCSDFIEHLKSSEHREELFDSVPSDEDEKPVLLCQLCQYPGYDKHNMNIHYNSDEHKHKLRSLEQDG